MQGDPGDGKSTLILNIAAKLSRGECIDENMNIRKQAEAVNEEAYERLDNIEEIWLKKHMTGKKKTFMEQLYLRNQARAMAEEIVINEIVFKCR